MAGNTSSPAYQVASLAAKVVLDVIKTAGTGPVLPLGYGLNVNFPALSGKDYLKTPIVQTRMNGMSEVDVATPVKDVPGTFTWGNIRPLAAGANVCLSGDCSLPDETYVVGTGKVSMSLYMTDYTAPTNWVTTDLRERFTAVVSGGDCKKR